MAINTTTRNAIKIGRQQADEVLKFREKELRQRKRAIKRQLKAFRAEGPTIAPKLVHAVGGPATAGILVAEGDSWFDYPLNDILRLLEDHHGYDVESVAHKGDRVEDMAYGLGQLEEFTRRIEKLLRRNIIPKAVLLSGGGNDVAGTEFGMLINHARSPVAGLNLQVISGVIDERIHFAYVAILSAITRLCEQRLNRHIPILVHGYDYPVPDGRGFLGGWSFLPGPWLEPGFREKGYEEINVRVELVGQLIDRFNAMLQSIVSLPDFSHVKYIDLRNTLSSGKNYKKDWANELHPTAAGFKRVTDRFAAELAALP
ncbi:MAG TPA: SGNH/GDSL hydrolase family protein [Thermodesulfobacteriota bacterium]|nr:SGNH/GDSL hydrolase family protein [Thermodesulfobacteriota bacterium]